MSIREFMGGLLWYLPPVAVYYSLLVALETVYPLWWFSGVAGLALAHAAYYLWRRDARGRSVVIYLGAALIGAGAAYTGYLEIGLLYTPLVIMAAGLWGFREMLFSIGMIALVEIPWLIDSGGEMLVTSVAYTGVACISGVVTYALVRWSAREALRGNEHPGRLGGRVLDAGGLAGETDPELREILRLAMLALGPASVSLFLIDESGELRFRCSTDGTLVARPAGAVYDAASLVNVIRGSAAGPGGRLAPGYSRAGRIGSFICMPVRHEGVVLGVLAADSEDAGFVAPRVEQCVEAFASLIGRVLVRARAVDAAGRDAEWLRVIYGHSASVLSIKEPRAVIEALFEGLARVADLETYVFLGDSEHGYMLVHDERGGGGPGDGPYSFEGTIADIPARGGQRLYVSSTGGYNMPVLPMDTRVRPEAALMLPLAYEGDELGLVALVSEGRDTLRPQEVDMLSVLVNQTAGALRNARLYAETRRLAVTDALTGLFNRRSFIERLEHELSVYRRSGTRVSLLLIDIDHFKRVNDTYGHRAGDEVLKHVAALLMDTVREVDMAARYGGEEFAAILSGTAHEGAYRMAERLRERVEHARIQTDVGTIAVTASIGIGTCHHDVSETSALIESADQALYKAKESGRNQVLPRHPRS